MHARLLQLNWRRLAAIFHDLVMTAAAIVVCFYIRFGPADFIAWAPQMGLVMLALVPLAGVVYWAFGLYRGIWRFASVPDLLGIIKAVTVLTAALALMDFATRGVIVVPRGVVAGFWFVQCALLGGPRLLFRVYRDGRFVARNRRRGDAAIPVLVVGTDDEAEIVIRSLETDTTAFLRPVALLSTKHAHVGQRIRGVPVRGHTSDLDSVVAELGRLGIPPRRMVITEGALRREADIEAFIARASRLGLRAERMSRGALEGPSDGRVQLKPIPIEELLGRSTRNLDYEVSRSLIEGRRVLVTGGGGTVGSELCRQIAGLGCSRLMVIEISELALYQITRQLEHEYPGVPVEGRLCDVRQRKRIGAEIEQFRPELIFHAAALKHVPIVESHIAEGILTNTVGTVNVADAAHKVGVKAMILISTDKAVQPISVMGATKRAAESYCEALDTLAFARGNQGGNGAGRTRFIAVRFGNVLGSSGSVVPLFQEQLEQGGPITITHPDMKRYFMTLSEAVGLVLMASALGLAAKERISIFVLDMGEPVRITDLAERMIRLAGLEPGQDVEIKVTGVRAGEKLSEELFHSGEPLHPTKLPGILSAEPRDIAPATLTAQMRALLEASRSEDEAEMLRRLAAIVPEYRAARPH